MSLLKSVLNVEYGKNRYTIVLVRHLDNRLPVLLDRDIYKKLFKLGHAWYINDKSNIYTVERYTHKGEQLEQHIYMHDLVMRMRNKSADKANIIHINRINFDNRYTNLEYDTPDKAIVKNVKKKKRTIDLRELRAYGTVTDDLPTYVWYNKPDATHGSRFSIEIPGEVSWRSTSSRNLSIKYKLEETKKYMRYLKRQRPDIFDYFCMNGDLSLHGQTLLKEYDKIIRLAGYGISGLSNPHNPHNPQNSSKTDGFVQKNTSNMKPCEMYVLYRFDPSSSTNDPLKALAEYEDLGL